MPKKSKSVRKSARKQRKNSSFLTPDFLKKQKMLLEIKLSDLRELQAKLREEVKVRPTEERRGDKTEETVLFGEREKASRQLNDHRETIFQVRRALGLVNDLLAGKTNYPSYGECADCEKLIPQKRLEAMPWALRCVPCQNEADMPPLDDSLSEDLLEDSLV